MENKALGQLALRNYCSLVVVLELIQSVDNEQLLLNILVHSTKLTPSFEVFEISV